MAFEEWKKKLLFINVYVFALIAQVVMFAPSIVMAEETVSVNTITEDVEREGTQEQSEKILTLIFWDDNTGKTVSSETVFYIDGQPYVSSQGVLYVAINNADTSRHTCYAVASGYEKSNSVSFCFAEMTSDSYTKAMTPIKTDETVTVSHVIGILKRIDYLPGGGLYMEDGAKFELSQNFVAPEGLQGKQVLCTIKNGLVTSICECVAPILGTGGTTGGTTTETTEVPTYTPPKTYGKPVVEKSKEEKLLIAAREYNEALNGYFEALAQAAQKDLKKADSTSSTRGKELRKIDEARGSDRFLVMEASTPDAAINAAYEAFATYLDSYTEAGVELGKIDLDDDMIQIDARLINKIANNIDTSGVRRQKYGNYYAKISATRIWNAFTGSVTVKTVRGNRTYTGMINSNSETVAEVYEQYLNELSDMSKDLRNQAMTSLVTEFIDVSGLGEFTKSELKKLLKEKVSILNKAGFGQNVLDFALELHDDYSAAKDVFELKDVSDVKNARDDIKKVYDDFVDRDYSDTTVTDKIVDLAVDHLSDKKDKFVNAMYDNLYDSNTYKEEEKVGWGNFKLFSIRCPVEFEIYENGNTTPLAYYTNGVISEAQNKVYIEVVGDTKKIWISPDVDVSLKLIATDDGFMNYTVEQYVDGYPTGRINYYDVPLTEGKNYTQSVGIQELDTTTTQMPLISEDGTSINADEYIAATTEATVTINCMADAGGIAKGSGEYVKGDTVTLSAITSDAHHEFTGWYINEELMSLSAIYRFTAEEDMTIRATYKEVQPLHPDYKTYVCGKYDDFAGVFVRKNNLLNDNTDIELGLGGAENIRDFEKLVIKGYQKGKEIFEQTVTPEVINGCWVTINNIDLGKNEYIEIYDATGAIISYVICIDGFEKVDCLDIKEDTLLDKNIYCESIRFGANLDLNGYNLIIENEVYNSYFSMEHSKEKQPTFYINNGTCIINADWELLDVNIRFNQGNLIVGKKFEMVRSIITMESDKDCLTVIGNCDTAYQTDHEISNGVIRFFGDVDFGASCKNNNVIICGSDKQHVDGKFANVYFTNYIISSSYFVADKIYTDQTLKILTTQNSDYSVGFRIENLNGCSVNIEGNVEFRCETEDLYMQGGNIKVNGDALGLLRIRNGNVEINGNMKGLPHIQNGNLTVNGNVERWYDDFEDTRIVSDSNIYVKGTCSDVNYCTILEMYNSKFTVQGCVEYIDLRLNNSKWYSAGDFNGNVDIEGKDSLLDINGNADIYNDNQMKCSSGTIRFAGDLNGSLFCDGSNVVIFDGKNEQNIGYDFSMPGFYFNDIKCENEQGILLWTNLGFKRLLSDLNVKIYSYDAKLVSWYWEYGQTYYDKTEVFDIMDLNGFEVHIDPMKNRPIAKVDAYINVNGGKIEVNGSLGIKGYVDLNTGELVVENDLLFGYEEKNVINERTGMLILNNKNDQVNVYGNLDMTQTTDDEIYEVNGEKYSFYPKIKGVLPAVSEGTINVYGNIQMNPVFCYEDIGNDCQLKRFICCFNGNNKVVLCGNNQEIEAYPLCFKNLQVTQSINNYRFSPNPCWQVLLDANGNIISDMRDDSSSENATAPKVGTIVKSSTAKYKVTGNKKGNYSVAYTKNTKTAASTVKIPNTVKVNGITYKVTSVAANAFKNNKKIKKVTIGSNVTKIDKYAFSGCTKLKTVTIGKNVKTIGVKAFYKCTALTKVTIPSKVTKIGTSAFEGCTKLKTVTIGKNVKTIGDKAFYKCTALTKITIPSKVNKIGKSAFANCKKLKAITIKTTKLTKKNVGSKAFKGIYSKATIKVPKSKLKTYKTLLKSKGVGSKVKFKNR